MSGETKTTTDVPEVDAAEPSAPGISSSIESQIVKEKQLKKPLTKSSSEVSMKHSMTTGNLSQFSRKHTIMDRSPKRKKTIDRFFKLAAGMFYPLIL